MLQTGDVPSSSTRFLLGRIAVCTLLLLLLAGGFGQTHAAGITLVQHIGKDAGTATTSTLSFASPNTAGNFIAVVIRGGLSSSQVFAVRDSNSNIYKQAVQKSSSGSAVTSAIYYAENIAGGSNTITVTMMVSGPLRFAILEYSGVSMSNSLDVAVAASTTSTSPNSGNLTTTTNGDLLLGEVATADSTTFTGGAGFTIRDFVPAAPNTKLITEDQIQATAGTASASATLNPSSNWAALLAAFKPAAGVAAPSIASLSPTSGPVGTPVTISGANFGASQGTSTITFNGVSAASTSWSNTSIVVPVPSGATSGNVVVTVGGAPSNGVAFNVLVPPSITSFVPGSGPVGTPVTINGANFGASQGTSTVTFNGLVATVSNWSSTSIVAIVPTGLAAGSATLQVTVNGLASNSFLFVVSPSITNVSPGFGPVGTSVTITGTDFGASQGTSTVTIGGAQATPTSWSATTIVATVPSGAASATATNLFLTVAGVNSNTALFTITPSITSLTPLSGPVTTAVTINGSNFGTSQGVSTVTFNGTPAIATSWAATSIVALVPNGATTGNVVVTVSGFASNGLAFTVTPSISSVSPSSGPAGAAVTLTGANFGAPQGASTVTFNGVAAIPTSWNNTSIVAPVPSGATTGNVVVTVGGVASNGLNFTVTPTPAISALSPASGPVGTSVTISGSNFGSTQSTSTVTFNGTLAINPTWSDTSITVPVPAGATTGNVVVSVGGITSNGVLFTVTPPPNITSLNPTSGAVGTSVTITGTNFGAPSAGDVVSFNGSWASITSWSPASVVATVPASATTGNVTVQVDGIASNGVSFTVTPVISSLSPTSGAPGTSVSISGTGFGLVQGASTVTFNGVAATPTAWGQSGIIVSVPASANSGNVLVTVNGVASNGVPFTVAPTITNLSPAAGSVGTSITINGTGFGSTQGTSTVDFNGAVGSPTSWSSTSIVVPVPVGATTGNVFLVVGNFVSNSIPFPVTPSIASLSPASGPVGTSVTITGSSLGATQGSSFVTFNGILASSVASWSATSIVVTVPGPPMPVAGPGADTGPVVVTVGGIASNGLTFTVIPSISNLMPASGNVGTSINVSGFGFGPAQGTSTITFNGTPANPTSWTDTVITVPVPNAAMSGNVVVTVGGNASNGVSFSVVPNITSLSILSGPVGTSVTINGTGFGSTQGTSSVTFNGTAGSPTFWSGTGIVVPIPTGATTGNLIVTVGGVASNAINFTVTPTISNLSPSSGSLGAAVTISGSSFGSTQGTSTVTFNGVSATATSWSNTSIQVTVPNGATTGNVIVTVGPYASNGLTFTVTTPGPSVTSLNPASGPVGASISISGVNFGASQGTSTVTFNGSAATPTSWSDTSIAVPVPSGATTGSVVVTVAGVASNGAPFTVLPTPTITNLNPSSAQVGTSVTITGTNFGGSQFNSTLTFNGIAATITSWSATSITAVVPITSTGNVVVTVGGVSSSGSNFTVLPSNIGSLSPASAPIGSSVTITGTGFGATPGIVAFNSTQSFPITSWNPTTIVVPVPSGATSGNVVVFVGGTPSNGVPFNVAPNITSLSPTSGPVDTSVTITGTGFGFAQGTSTVTFNGAAATPTSWSATSIVVQAPGGATTGNVVVTVGGVASNGVSFGVAPTITSLSPTSGLPGTSVAISGGDFGATQGTSTVTFNGVSASPSSWSHFTIFVPVPAGATAGNVVVTVAGVASNSVPFTVTAPPSPLTWGNMDEWLHMNTSSPGTALTSAILAAGSVGTPAMSSWTLDQSNIAVSSTSAFTIAASQGDMGGSITVNGVTYPVGTTTQSLALSNNVNFTYVITTKVPAAKQVVANGFVTFGAANAGTAGGKNFDTILLNDSNSGAAVVLQMTNGNPCYCVRLETNGAAGFHTSANIAITQGHRYSFSLLFDEIGGTAKLAIFDPGNNFAQVGSTTTAKQNTGFNFSSFRFGNAEAGTSSGTTTYFEDLMLDWTNHVFPNVPFASGGAGTPSSITATAGTPQNATVNTAFAAQLQATVKDSLNNPVSGVTVTFTAPTSGPSGTFAGGVNTAVTNASGVATSADFTANTIAGGPYTASASVGGVSTPAGFSLTNVAGAASSITAAAGTPQSATINTAFPTQLQAAVKDSFNNPVSGVTVTFTAPASGASGTFAGGVNTAVTSASGVAAAPVFTANGTTGSYTVTASAPGVATVANFSLTNVSAPPASITATVGTPQSATINTAFNTAFQATVKDASNNPVSGVTVTFTAPTSGPSGTFAGGVNTATTNSSGVATSPVFTANAIAGAYTVTASVSVGTPANFSLTNLAGPAANITATSGTPQSAAINTAFAAPLQATVTDSLNNPLSGVTVTFTAPASGASGAFAGGVNTATTNAQGIATSTVFTANATVGGPYTVTASASGVASQANFSLTNLSAAGNIALVQHRNIDASTATSNFLAFANTTTAGNFIAVCIRAGGSSSQVFTVTDSSGNTYRQAFKKGLVNTVETFAIYYAENIIGGPDTIHVQQSVNASLRFIILEYSGVATSNSLDGAPVTAEGSNASPNSGNLTTTASGDLLVGIMITKNIAAFTARNGFTIEEAVQASPNTRLIAEDQLQSAAGTVSAAASIHSSDNWGAGLAAFRSISGSVAPISVSISPGSGSLPSGYGAQAFAATVTNDFLNRGVTWSLSGAGCSGNTCGTLSRVTTTSVTYTAPSNIPIPATVTLTATSIGDTAKSASATLTVTQGVLTVVINPKRAAVTLGSSPIQFSANVYNDASNAGVTWQVDGNNGGTSVSGTISATGLYTPGTQSGAHTVTAVSNANASASGSALIAVTDLTGVYTHHNDNSRTGQNLQEYGLTPSTVSSATFGQLFSCPVDGDIYAQPLWVANLNFSGTTRNVVFIATEHDSVYAFDADSPSCVQLWKKSFLSSGVTTLTPADVASNNDLYPEIGITSTPVIDPATNTLYVVPKTRETVGTVNGQACSTGAPCYAHRLHALDLFTGSEKFGGPVIITAANFNSQKHLQRPALLLANNTLYLAFGSHGDQCPYQGWVMGYNPATLAQTFAKALSNPTTCNQGAIWMSGAGPSADANGNIYVVTANGLYDGTSNFGDTVAKLSPIGSLLDWFTPFNQATLAANDVDLGSSAVLILPDAVGSLAHPHLALTMGKTAVVYLLDQANMGKFNSAASNDVQEVIPVPPMNTTMDDGGNYVGPAFWNGNIYVTGQNYPLSQFQISNGVIATPQFAASSNTFPPRGGAPVVSANGATGGVLWIIDYTGFQNNTAAVLYAYDANNVATMLYSSPASGAGAAGNGVKFTVPTVANGKVYVGCQVSFTVYGLLPN